MMFAQNQATIGTTGFKLLSLLIVFAMSFTLLVPAYAADNEGDEGDSDRMSGSEFIDACSQGGGTMETTRNGDGAIVTIICNYSNGESVTWCADSTTGGDAGSICKHSEQKPASLPVSSGFNIGGATQVAPTPAKSALPVFQIQFSTQIRMIGK